MFLPSFYSPPAQQTTKSTLASESSASTQSRPTKSVLRRSRSVRKNAGDGTLSSSGEGGTSADVSRCIPKGLDSGHGGLLIPTKPYGMDSNSRFVDSSSTGMTTNCNKAPSPEWGWYINTTPPTPEMYHAHSSSSGINHQSHNGTVTTTTIMSHHRPVFAGKPSLSSRPTALTNPAFARPSTKHHGAAMGWASIPL